jgi:hypothetical protein
VLTLTATPIPRTLGMALEGLRDFSIIATAPQKRLAIKTFVRSEDDSVIREACLRELKRGGQVYFLHNEVETIENRKAMLEALLPEARVVVAHGQMHERDLKKSCVISLPNGITSCCVRLLSKPVSTYPPRIPSSCTAPINSASRSCTSCADVLAARIIRLMRICWYMMCKG